MAREVTDHDKTVWTCIQAYAGLHEDAINKEAARNDDTGTVTVVCTPSGGARSARLELDSNWEAAMPDDTLLTHIATSLRDSDTTA